METRSPSTWRCRKHPLAAHPPAAVCPSCLRDRLLLLCPDCSANRPCACSSSCPSSTTTSSSAATTSSSFLIRSLSLDPAATTSSSFLIRSLSLDPAAGGGAVGRVSDLIGNEAPYGKSRLTALRQGGRRWASWLWPWKGKGAGADVVTRIYRSKSVEGSRRSDVTEGKAWNSYLASPVKALRQLSVRSRPAALHQPSPLCRG